MDDFDESDDFFTDANVLAELTKIDEQCQQPQVKNNQGNVWSFNQPKQAVKQAIIKRKHVPVPPVKSEDKTPILSSSTKKKFKFLKSAPTPIRFNPPSPIPVFDIEDDDDIDWERVGIEAEKGAGVKSEGIKAKVKVVPPIQIPQENESDKRWKEFLREFEVESKFRSLFFQSMPITALNISCCKGILDGAQEPTFLVQLAKLIISFVKQILGAAEVDNEDDRIVLAEDELRSDGTYCNELIMLLEQIFLKLDFLFETGTFVDHSKDASQTTEFGELAKDVWNNYIAGHLNLSFTRIPQLLLKSHPAGPKQILQPLLQKGQFDLILPLCEKNEKNFMLILTILLENSSAKADNDGDFQSPPLQFNLALKFFNRLISRVGGSIVKLVPYPFQALVSFAYAIELEGSSLFNDRNIIKELFVILNDILIYTDCGDDAMNKTLLNFFIFALPNLKKILTNERIIKKVTFKEWPYLWKFLKSFK